jgi:argininosuccinate synthase
VAYAARSQTSGHRPWRVGFSREGLSPSSAHQIDRQDKRGGRRSGRRQPSASSSEGSGGPAEGAVCQALDPEQAPDKPAYIGIDFERGDAVAVDGKKLSAATILTELNKLGRAHGIGRLDLVENRFVGMKSRGMYETPGGTILIAAHRGIESITLDRGAAHLKDELMPKYAELIYNGFWFTPEREMLQAAIDRSQEFVTGSVRLKLYKGNVAVVGRSSPYSLYDQDLVTFEEGKVAYDHRDAAGFIRLNALRLRTLAQRRKKLKL